MEDSVCNTNKMSIFFTKTFHMEGLFISSNTETLHYLRCKIYMIQITKDELVRRYLSKIDDISYYLEDKTTFEPEEICRIIYDIIEDAPVKIHNYMFPVIYCGIKNKNGRVYGIDEVTSIIDSTNKQIEEESMPGCIGYPDDTCVDLTKVTHFVSKFEVSDGILWAKINFLNEYSDNLHQLLKDDLIVFRPIMYATLYPMHGIDYVRINKIIGVHAVPTNTDSYNLNNDNE